MNEFEWPQEVLAAGQQPAAQPIVEPAFEWPQEVVAEQATGMGSSFALGAKASVPQFKAGMYGLAGLAGSLGKSLTGGTIGQGLESWGAEGAKKNLEAAQAYQPAEGAATFSEADSFQDYANWAGWNVGNQLLNIGALVVPGIVGAKVATTGVGLAAGLGGSVAKTMGAGATGASTRLLAREAAILAPGAVLKGGATPAMAEAAAGMVAKAAQRGAGLGVLAGGSALEAGGMQNEQTEAGLEPTPWTNLGAGVLAGALELPLLMKLAGRLGLGRVAKEGAEEVAKAAGFLPATGRFVKNAAGVLKDAVLLEGLPEAAQGIIEDLVQENALKENGRPYDWDKAFDPEKRLEEGAVGTLLGVLFGGAGRIAEGRASLERKIPDLQARLDAARTAEEAKVAQERLDAALALRDKINKELTDEGERKIAEARLKGYEQQEAEKARTAAQMAGTAPLIPLDTAAARQEEIDRTLADAEVQEYERKTGRIGGQGYEYGRGEQVPLMPELAQDRTGAEFRPQGPERLGALPVPPVSRGAPGLKVEDLTSRKTLLPPDVEKRTATQMRPQPAAPSPYEVQELPPAEELGTLQEAPLPNPFLPGSRIEQTEVAVRKGLATPSRLPTSVALGRIAQSFPQAEQTNAQTVRSDQGQVRRQGEEGLGQIQPMPVEGGGNLQQPPAAEWAASAARAGQEGEGQEKVAGRQGSWTAGRELFSEEQPTPTAAKSVEVARKELDNSLGGLFTTKRMEENGLLRLVSDEEAQAEGWKPSTQAVFDEKTGRISLRTSAKNKAGVLLHEATHAGDELITHISQPAFAQQLVRQMKGGDKNATSALAAAERAVANTILRAEAKGETLSAERVAYLRAKESIAYFVEQAQLRKGQKAGGALKRVLGAVKAWVRTTDFGQRMAKRGITFKLDDATALNLAKRALKAASERKDLVKGFEQRAGMQEGKKPAAQAAGTMASEQDMMPVSAVRYTVNGKGLLNNQVLNRDKLTDDEDAELTELLDFGLQQPSDVAAGQAFFFTPEGEKEHARLITLLKKAAKGKVVREAVQVRPTWESGDGQVAGQVAEPEPDGTGPKGGKGRVLPWRKGGGEKAGKAPGEKPAAKGSVLESIAMDVPPEAVTKHIAELDGSGRYHIRLSEREKDHAKDRIGLKVGPELTKGLDVYVSRTYQGQDEGRLYIDPAIGVVREDEWAPGYVRRVADLRPDSGLVERPEKGMPDKEEGFLWRGMSTEEMQELRKTGVIGSKGDMNFEGQAESTSFGTRASSGFSYAHGFAPARYKAAFGKPAYVIKLRDPGQEAELHVEGMSRDYERSLKNGLPASSIVEVWEGVPYGMEDGQYDVVRDWNGKWEDGSRSSPNIWVGWRKLENEFAQGPAYRVEEDKKTGEFRIVGRNGEVRDEYPAGTQGKLDAKAAAESLSKGEATGYSVGKDVLESIDLGLIEEVPLLVEQEKKGKGRRGKNVLESLDVDALIAGPKYKTWAEGLPLATSRTDYRGGPAVFLAYHGTTHPNIERFEERGNAEGWLGVGPYFTTEPEDASENYAGVGPDLTARIDLLAEQIGQDVDRYRQEEMLADYYENSPRGQAQVEGHEDWQDSEEGIEAAWSRDADDAVRWAAEQALKGPTEGLIMPQFVKLKKPADLTGETYEVLTYEQEEDEEGDFIGEPTGTLMDWVDAVRELEWTGMDVDSFTMELMEEGMDGNETVKDVHELLRKGNYYGTDDNGETISAGGLFRMMAKDLGYDGIVMDAWEAFNERRGFGGVRMPGMKGVNPDTLHIVPFEPENKANVKNALGSGFSMERGTGVLESQEQSAASDAGRVSTLLREPPALTPEQASSFARDNAQLREEYRTPVEKGKDLLAKAFAPGGLLGTFAPGAYPEIQRRDARQRKADDSTERLVRELEREAATAWGQKWDALPQARIDAVSAALSGDNKVFASLPEKVQDTVAAMRLLLDPLSLEYAREMARKTAADGDGSTRSEAQQLLMRKILDNVGKYLNRSFQMFDNEKWATSVPPDVLNRARLYLMQEEGMTQEEASAYMNRLLKNGTAYDSLADWIREGKVGEKDMRVLIKRKDIAPELLDLMGVYTDPRINFAKTAAKLSRLVYNSKLQNELRRIGLANGWLFEKDQLTGRPPGITQTIGGGKAYEELADLETYPEVKQALRDILKRNDNPAWLKGVMQVAYLAKWAKTVGSPLPTGVRNYASAWFGLLANADWSGKGFKEALAGWEEYLANKDAGRQHENLQYKKLLGVSLDAPFAGEMKDLSEQAGLDALIQAEGGTMKEGLNKAQKGLFKAKKGLERFYQFGDDFVKIIAFESQRAQFDKAIGERLRKEWGELKGENSWEKPVFGRVELRRNEKDRWEFVDAYGENIRKGQETYATEQEARAVADEVLAQWEVDNTAAERIRNTYMTYSMVGALPKWLARFPLTGTFVSFPVEVLRTVSNQIHYMASDLRNPELRGMGLRRLVGLAAMGASAHAVVALMQAALGVDDDELEEAREALPEWNKLSNMAPVGRDEKGQLELFNFGFVDLYQMWRLPFNAWQNRDPLREDFKNVVKELALPFVGLDITTKAVYEVLRNEKASGGPIWDYADSPLEQSAKATRHLINPFVPSTLLQMEKVAKAADGTVLRSGEEMRVGKEMGGLFGWKTQTVNPSAALWMNHFSFAQDRRAATGGLVRAINDPNRVDGKDLREKFDQALATRKDVYEKFLRKIGAAQRLGNGMSNFALAQELKNLGIAQREIPFLLKGKIPPWMPDSRTFLTAEKKGEVLYSAEQQKEIAQRRRMVLKWMAAEARAGRQGG